MAERRLPPEFADLEPFAEAWCLATEPERFAKRMASDMDEMQALYDAATPRIRDALDYCDRFPLDALPPDAQRLMELVYSTAMVSMCVEVWHQPRIIDAADAKLVRTVDPGL